MNPEQDGGSLADRTAAWVPPWERPIGGADSGETASADTEADAELTADADADAEPQADVDLTADGDGEPEADVDLTADAEVDAELSAAIDDVDRAEDVEPVDDVDRADDASRGDGDRKDDRFAGLGPTPFPGLAGAELGAALEAILMVVDEPVTEAQLADVLDVAPDDVAERLTALASDYAASGRGFELRRAAGGWRYYTRGEYSGYVERFVLDGQSARLTQAALETLAVVAYRQPVTRSRISAIRGVNCDGVVRTLVTRGLLEESGTQPETGAYLYRTTALFLEKLGLDSVDELPPLAPFLPDDVNGLTDAQR